MRKTDWTKWSAIAEILSSFAIVVTLFYLAAQTKQVSVQTEQMALQSALTTNAILATSRQETMSADIQMIAAMISTPEAWSNIDRPFSELTHSEQAQARNVYAGLLRIREYAWFQYKNGILDEATLQTYLNPLPRWIARASGGELWERHSADLDPEFVSYVNALISRSEQE